MTSESRGPAETWLKYFHDLGISSFYLDRAAALDPGAKASPSLALAAAAAAQNSLPTRPLPPAAPFKSTVHSVPLVPLLPVIKTASLFEVNERVAGDSLERIRADIGDCKRCKLCQKRTNIVFGAGSATAELVFVGEGPGHDEDIQALPFVGRAGKLLTQMIEAMGLRRDDVYICNVVKCRPPENRTPEPDEVQTCSPFLFRQLDVIRPKVIVCLGAVAFQSLLGAKQSISRLRGQWLEFRGLPLLATYHPAYLLRNPSAKGEVWEDLKKVMAHLGLKPPSKR
ncbi:MAG TPA: uracil-DNA glycosylase [Candidatus Acidoferrales bacterium]|nr:uracil-DNA glycosylase [Candidatus Acidoferrales bacterium]